MVELASLIVAALSVYAGIGLPVALLCTGLLGGPGPARMDPAARAMPLSARLLILPGTVALWPLMLLRWLKRQYPPLA